MWSSKECDTPHAHPATYTTQLLFTHFCEFSRSTNHATKKGITKGACRKQRRDKENIGMNINSCHLGFTPQLIHLIVSPVPSCSCRNPLFVLLCVILIRHVRVRVEEPIYGGAEFLAGFAEDEPVEEIQQEVQAEVAGAYTEWSFVQKGAMFVVIIGCVALYMRISRKKNARDIGYEKTMA